MGTRERICTDWWIVSAYTAIRIVSLNGSVFLLEVLNQCLQDTVDPAIAGVVLETTQTSFRKLEADLVLYFECFDAVVTNHLQQARRLPLSDQPAGSGNQLTG